MGTVVKEIKTILEKEKIAGVYTELAGDYATQQKSFKELIFAFLSGIALIFIVSFFFLNHWKTTILITLAALIPPSVGMIGLVLSGIALDVSSFSGLISVTGVAVANIYMAISHIQEKVLENLEWKEAILQGMQDRLRPILMTNLAAMAGFIPIALSLVEGDEILRPFSIAIIIGLFGSMLTTLFLMPLLLNEFCKNLFVNHSSSGNKGSIK